MKKKRYIAFELTMPNRGSWNGKWSGESDKHLVTRLVSEDTIGKILDTKHWHYSWNDGWGANITATEVDSKERKKIERKNYGFAGYEWMIDSILRHNVIKVEKS